MCTHIREPASGEEWAAPMRGLPSRQALASQSPPLPRTKNLVRPTWDEARPPRLPPWRQGPDMKCSFREEFVAVSCQRKGTGWHLAPSQAASVWKGARGQPTAAREGATLGQTVRSTVPATSSPARVAQTHAWGRGCRRDRAPPGSPPDALRPPRGFQYGPRAGTRALSGRGAGTPADGKDSSRGGCTRRERTLWHPGLGNRGSRPGGSLPSSVVYHRQDGRLLTMTVPMVAFPQVEGSQVLALPETPLRVYTQDRDFSQSKTLEGWLASRVMPARRGRSPVMPFKGHGRGISLRGRSTAEMWPSPPFCLWMSSHLTHLRGASVALPPDRPATVSSPHPGGTGKSGVEAL